MAKKTKTTEEFVDLNEQYQKQKTKAEKKETSLANKLAEANKEIADWKNEYAKVLADTQNLRRLLEKDQKEFIKYRAVGFLENLIPVLDSFEFAFSVAPPSKETQNYLVGFKMIYTNLVNSLIDEGLKEIRPSVGTEFDPNQMEASEVQSDTNYPDGVVLKTNLPGYSIHERLVRPANVIVNDLSKKD